MGANIGKRGLKGLSREPINMPRNSREKAKSNTHLPSVGGSSVTKAHLLPEQLSSQEMWTPMFVFFLYLFVVYFCLALGFILVVVSLFICLFIFVFSR